MMALGGPTLALSPSPGSPMQSMLSTLVPCRLMGATLATGLLGLAGVRAALPMLAPDPEVRFAGLVDDWQDEAPGHRVLEMRAINPEYDFMSRTFLVLALADRALANPAVADHHIALMDTIIADTLSAEAAHEQDHWLMSYWRPDGTLGTGRSLFVDGEVLVMVTARRILRDDAPWLQAETARRSELVRRNLGSGSDLPLAESYADEGWLFCHGMALMGLRAEEVLDGVDHRPLFEAFSATARSQLRDTDGSGMLVSSFTMDGASLDGPEGSSIWFATAALSVVDPALAQEQYALARGSLGRSILGLGYAREWAEDSPGQIDVDSGPIVPLLDASTSSSGFAIAAARVHGDDRWSAQLDDALGAAEALLRASPELAEWASNPVGDAVIVWGQGVGPLFDRLRPAA